MAVLALGEDAKDWMAEMPVPIPVPGLDNAAEGGNFGVILEDAPEEGENFFVDIYLYSPNGP